MTFSNPQPIPSRSSHPAAHHRPAFRRTQSHNLTSTTSSSSTPTTTDSGKYNYFESAINTSQDNTIYDHDDEDEEEQETYGRPHDSGHYTSDMDDDSSLGGIPIGKPGFYPNFFSTAASSGGMDVRANLNRRSHPAPGSNYSAFRANGDGHHSINVLAHNTNDTSHNNNNNFSKSATAPINIPSSPNTFAIVSSTSSTTSSPSHIASIKIPRAAKSSDTKAQVFNTHAHYPHPNISIDTSKARLRPPVLPKASSSEELPGAQKAVAPSSSFSTKAKQGQLFGLKKDDKEKEKEKDKVLSSSLAGTSSSPHSTFAAISTSSATRPMMMGNPSRSLSGLPPAPQQDSSSVLLPSLSPSSPRANSALVNSLEQLSVSWKAPEQTPTFPINRLHRSRTMSSGTRPFTNTSSFSSNSSDSNLTNYVSPPSMVTSSSYSSLPYSPAVAFLSNFVEVTAPRMAPDEEGEQVGDFIMGKVIGHGGFSVVREAFAIHMDGLVARVAVKVFKPQTGANNDRMQRMLDKEVAIWSRLSHPNVLPFVAVEKLPTSTFVFCELCTGGQLLDYLTKEGASSGSGRSGLEECKAREIFNQIAEAVRYLHEEKRIVHRDIKLENVLQHEDGTWKICDFGLAEYQNDEAASYFGSPLSPTIYNPRAKSQVVPGDSPTQRSDDDEYTGEEEDDCGGSLAYCSPEQLRSQKPLRCPSSDVWSLGVVLYALLTGRLPFQDEYEPRLQYQILNGRYEEPTECSAEARELLKNMFRAKPEDRWKIGQVLDSPWCTGTLQEPTMNSGASFGNMNMGGFFSSYRA
ncbi:hypothetical protein BGZ93_001429 [Podila epicladia]|nr:hypothetical protein BGZ92_004123 [Podila epicladia]KAG0100402.1 hypothetical protein BGZ93_001429 [Podila epicladia]